jgi:hypothetical protein
VILLGFLDPNHIIKQQVVAIGGRQPLVGETGTTDNYGSELSYLRMNAKCPCHNRSRPSDSRRTRATAQSRGSHGIIGEPGTVALIQIKENMSFGMGSTLTASRKLCATLSFALICEG